MGRLIDRLEELLALMGTEDEDDGQEDVLPLEKAAAPAVSPQREGGIAETETDGPPDAESGWEIRRPGQAAAEGLMADVPRVALGDESEWPMDGAVWEAETAVWRRAAAEALGQIPWAMTGTRAGTVEAVSAGRGAGAGGGWSAAETADRRETGTGVELLYRQTVQASRPASPALPGEQAGRAVRETEPGSAASLAVEELDRAVRRDSRRYDGGISIF